MDLSRCSATSSAVMGMVLMASRQRWRRVGAIDRMDSAANFDGAPFFRFLKPGAFGYFPLKSKSNCSASNRICNIFCESKPIDNEPPPPRSAPPPPLRACARSRARSRAGGGVLTRLVGVDSVQRVCRWVKTGPNRRKQVNNRLLLDQKRYPCARYLSRRPRVQTDPPGVILICFFFKLLHLPSNAQGLDLAAWLTPGLHPAPN